MADKERNPEQSIEVADRGSTTGTPRWVKVFGLVAVVVIALFIVVLLVRGGEHGPGRHSGPSDTPMGHTGPPAGVTHTQP